jgi:hypothetical protein
MTTIWLIYFWSGFWCTHYGVDLPFALAVAATESGVPGQEFRVNLLAGKWFGPYNIHKDFLLRWPDIDTISGNCRAGVRALRGRDKRRILKRYNPEMTPEYYQAVMRAEKRYRRVMRGQR